MTGPTREEVEALAAAFRKATFSKGRTVGGICGQTIDAMMASTMHEVSALALEQGADALETLAAENAALRERLEAAEAACVEWSEVSQRNYKRAKKAEQDNADLQAKVRDEQHRRFTAETALTEARAREAAAWEAAARVADHYAEINYCAMGYPEDGGIAASGTADTIRREIRAAAPPDATAALTARLDAELERAAAEADACPDSHWGPWIASRIRALRRNTETSND